MSCRREAATNAVSVALVAGDEARVLPRLEVLGHRRRHHDERGQRVLQRRLVLLRGGVELVGLLLEVARGGDVEVGVGQRLAELDLAVAVEVGLDALGGELRLGAVQRRLDQEVEVARLLEGLAGRRLEVERDGGRRVGAVAAGVDDHVVVGERRGRRRRRPPSPRRPGWRPGSPPGPLLISSATSSRLLARAASRSRSRRPRRARSRPRRPRGCPSTSLVEARGVVESGRP